MISSGKVGQMVAGVLSALLFVLVSASASDRESDSCGHSMAWGISGGQPFSLRSDFLQQLPRLVFGCIREVDLVETVERLSRANNSLWWEAFLVHLHYAEFGPVEGLDQQYMKSLAPEEPDLAGLYALVMQRVTDAPDFWTTELSRIVQERPEVVGQIRSGDAPLHLDMAFLSDWIVAQDPQMLRSPTTTFMLTVHGWTKPWMV